MGDSLDDFFAKKDKKQRKNKPVVTAEALVRELEEGSRQVEYTARKENKTSATLEMLGLNTDDADWKDFEDIEKKDYTGLKIKELSLQEQNEEDFRRLQAEHQENKEESSVWKTTKDSNANTKEGTSTTTTTTATSGKTSDSLASKLDSESADTELKATETASDKEDAAATTTDDASSSVEDKEKSAVAETSEGQAEKKKEETGDTPSATTVKAPYRPPSARNKPTSLEPSKMPRRNPFRGSSHVPDLENQNDFPGLG